MFNTVKQISRNYCDQIPSDTFPKVAKSALYTFTATLLMSGNMGTKNINLAHSLFAAGVASLASLIYALINPFFHAAFGDDRVLFHRELIKQVFVAASISVIVDALTVSKVNLLSLKILTGISINLLKGLIESVPSFYDWVGDHGTADQIRQGYQFLGIDAKPGSSTVFFTLGNGYPI